MAFYVNSFISILDSIATNILDFFWEHGTLIENMPYFLFIGVYLIYVIIPDFIRTIKLSKTQKTLDVEIPKIACKYYENKYNSKLDKYSFELDNSLESLGIEDYRGSGYVYIDDDRTKYIHVSLNLNFNLIDINDNIEDDIILKSIKSYISNIEDESNLTYFINLHKNLCINDQYRYTSISKYFAKNTHIKPKFIIVHKVDDSVLDFNYICYCSNYAEKLYSLFKQNFNDIDIELGIYFTKSNEFYNYILTIINECESLDSSPIYRIAVDHDNYLMKNDNYYYYVFDR